MSKHHGIPGSRSWASVVVLTPLVFGMAGMSQAALIDCPASFTTTGTAKVHDGTAALNTAANACQYISPSDPSTVANEANVNLAAFFGHNDWEITSVDQVDANAASGTWMIPSVNFADFDYIITFKDGQDTNLISFRFNELYSSGGWNTPFTEPPFTLGGASTAHNVSHYSIFRREGGGTIVLLPEPGTIALLGLGILGMGWVARRSTH